MAFNSNFQSTEVEKAVQDVAKPFTIPYSVIRLFLRENPTSSDMEQALGGGVIEGLYQRFILNPVNKGCVEDVPASDTILGIDTKTSIQCSVIFSNVGDDYAICLSFALEGKFYSGYISRISGVYSYKNMNRNLFYVSISYHRLINNLLGESDINQIVYAFTHNELISFYDGENYVICHFVSKIQNYICLSFVLPDNVQNPTSLQNKLYRINTEDRQVEELL